METTETVVKTFFGQNFVFVRDPAIADENNGNFFRDEPEGMIRIENPLAEITLVLGAISLISRETVLKFLIEQGDKIMTADEVLHQASKIFSELMSDNDDRRLADGVKYILLSGNLLDLPSAIELFATPGLKRGLYESLPKLEDAEPDDPLMHERESQVEYLKCVIGLPSSYEGR